MLIQLNKNNYIREKSSFTLIHSQISRGIASLSLLYHHLFYSKSSHSKWPNYLIFKGINFRTQIARYLRICTGIFAFISGIGLFFSLIHKKNYI